MTPIFNRQAGGFVHPADGFYQVEAVGYHPNGGLVQVIDQAAVQAMVNRFNADAQAGTLRYGHEMLVDHEHFSGQLDQETRAYGWLLELQARPDGMYGRIRWTATWQPAVDGGDYRYFSTEYDGSDLVTVPATDIPANILDRYPGANFVRPLRLDGLTLTNCPNNKGQKPLTISNRAASPAALSGLSALEKFCGAVSNVMAAATSGCTQMMDFSAAWRYAKQRFPDLYAAAFNFAAVDSQAIANRIRPMIGGSDLAHGFVRREFPGLNRQPQKTALNIMNRAKELRQSNPALSFRGATAIALREGTAPANQSAKDIMNRAQALRRANPSLSLTTATRMSQQDSGTLVFNRALAIQRETGCDLATGVRRAQAERPNAVWNRALELRERCPRLSLATAVIIANRESGTAADSGQPSDADWAAANDKADTVLASIQAALDSEKGTGIRPVVQDRQMELFCAVDNLCKAGLTVFDAFAKVRQENPGFWTDAVLKF